MKKNILRGLRDVRTHGSRCGGPRPRHEIMMAMTTLEMERSRRETELNSLRARVAALERRLGEIDAESGRLAASLEPAPPATNAQAPFVLRY